MIKNLYCPLTGLQIVLIVGEEKEGIQFAKNKIKKGDNQKYVIDSFDGSCDGQVFILQPSAFLVYLRMDESTGNSVSYDTLVHEVFHLWTRIKSIIYGSDTIKIDINQDEESAYHFATLFTMIEKEVVKHVKRFDKKTKLFNEMMEHVREDEKIKSEEIPFIAVGGTDRTAEEIIAELKEENK